MIPGDAGDDEDMDSPMHDEHAEADWDAGAAPPEVAEDSGFGPLAAVGGSANATPQVTSPLRWKTCEQLLADINRQLYHGVSFRTVLVEWRQLVNTYQIPGRAPMSEPAGSWLSAPISEGERDDLQLVICRHGCLRAEGWPRWGGP